MTSPPTKMTSRQLLHMREENWRKRLSPTRVSLIAEDTDTTSPHSEQALRVLGRLWIKEGASTSSLLRQFPAVHVLTTTRVATDHYDASFWPRLCELAEIPRDQGIQQAWGTAYNANLADLNLPTFEDVEDRGSRFVGPILMHSGVPTYCLPDLMRLIRDRRRQTLSLTPEIFVDWAGERARQDRLTTVDKPVQRFLRYGGEFAVDVVDRVFELLDIVDAGGDGQEVELPDRFIETAADLRSAGEILSPRFRTASDEPGAAPRRAELMLDPYGRGPFVRLPSIPDAAEGQVVWVVGADAEEERFASAALLPGYREPTPQVDVPVNRPVRQVSARLEGSFLELSLPVVDSERPLLVFDEEGRQIALASTLRGSAVWVVHPETSPLVAPATDKIQAEAALPPGWDGWRLVLLDLQDVSEVSLDDGTTVRVQARATPRIHMSTPVQGVRTMAGEPVFGQLPEITLPDLGESGASWSVSLVDHTGAALLRKDVSTDEELERLWTDAPSTLCGDVLLRVRGPWGRGASRRFTVVQGLAVVSTPSWRRMTTRGLTSAAVALSTAPGIRLGTSQLTLGPSQVHDVVSVSTGPEKLLLVVEAPHMSVSHLTPARTGAESIRALRLQTESILDEPGVLVVRTGAEASPTLFVHGRDALVQTVEAQAQPGSSAVYRFPLSQVTDTLRTEQLLRLSLDREAELIVAVMRPGQLFSDIHIESADLHLEDAPDVDGLTAICYQTLAPWVTPVPLTVTNGVAHLPPELVECGPLLVHVRVEDPWVSEPVPEWPRFARWASQDGHLAVGSQDDISLSAFLAGTGDLDGYEGNLSRVWKAYSRVWNLKLGDRAPGVDAKLRSTLRERPDDALQALATAAIEPERIPVVLARSGLVAQPLDGSLPAPDQPTFARRSNILPMTFLGAWLGDEDGLDDLVAVCGEVVRDLVTGDDPLDSIGGFDHAADFLARKTPNERKRIYVTAGIVPAGLLEKDTRVLAADVLLANREDPRLRWLRSNVGRLITSLRQTFTVLDFDAALAAMDARRNPTRSDGWRAIPEWSIGMAFACRLAALRDLHLPVVNDGLRALEDLAIVAPDLVTIDLVVSDLLARATHTEEFPA